jgi:hypothetical protein
MQVSLLSVSYCPLLTLQTLHYAETSTLRLGRALESVNYLSTSAIVGSLFLLSLQSNFCSNMTYD